MRSGVARLRRATGPRGRRQQWQLVQPAPGRAGPPHDPPRADSGARRGELVAPRFDDLDGRVLRICRSASADVITTPRSGHARTLTLGSATARLWRALEQDWQQRSVESLGPWVFSPETTHSRRLTNAALGHRFEHLRSHAGVPGATLHRLRHNVAPSSSPAARSSKPKPASVTPTPQRRCASTPTHSPSPTRTSPTRRPPRPPHCTAGARRGRQWGALGSRVRPDP
jgi:integrase